MQNKDNFFNFIKGTDIETGKDSYRAFIINNYSFLYRSFGAT